MWETIMALESQGMAMLFTKGELVHQFKVNLWKSGCVTLPLKEVKELTEGGN